MTATTASEVSFILLRYVEIVTETSKAALSDNNLKWNTILFYSLISINIFLPCIYTAKLITAFLSDLE